MSLSIKPNISLLKYILRDTKLRLSMDSLRELNELSGMLYFMCSERDIFESKVGF